MPTYGVAILLTQSVGTHSMDTDARKRTLASLLLAIGALVLGLVAQVYFGRVLRAPAPTDGLLVLATAVVLFAVAFLRAPPQAGLLAHPAVPPPAEEALLSRERPGGWVRDIWRLGAVTVLFALAGVATIVSLDLFRADVEPQLKWLLYLLSVVLFLSGVYVLEPPSWGRSVFDLWRDPVPSRDARYSPTGIIGRSSRTSLES